MKDAPLELLEDALARSNWERIERRPAAEEEEKEKKQQLGKN